jgi:hypothetical protein
MKRKFNQMKFIIRHAFVSLSFCLSRRKMYENHTKNDIFIYSMHDKLQMEEFRGW